MKSKDIFDSDDEEEEHEEEDENESDGQEEKEKNEEKEINDQKDKTEEKFQEENNNDKTKKLENLSNNNTIELNEESPKEKSINKTLYGIFIKGLQYEVTEEHLKNIFGKYGEIIKIKLPKYQNTNKNMGHCHIYFNNEKSAIKSLELNKKKIGKRYMEISLSNPITNHMKEKGAIDPNDVPLDCKTAFVKNLNYNITQQEVEEQFKPCGEINSIRFMYDKQANKFKGFCYIDFKEHKGLLKALKLNGSFFGKRRIKVDYEQGRPKMGKYADDN